MTDPNDDQRDAAARTARELLRPALERAGTMLVNPPQHVLDALRWRVEHGDRCRHLQEVPVQPSFILAGHWLVQCEVCFLGQPRIPARHCHTCGVVALDSPGAVLICDAECTLILRLCDECRSAVGALHSPDLRPASG